MPIRNEASYLAQAVASIQNQQLPEGWKSELVVALAQSEDSSAEILSAIQREAEAGWLRVIENPAGDTAGGLNLAIAAANGEVIIRVDGHSVLPANYASTGIRILLADASIANTGGMMVAIGGNSLQSAIAWAYGSHWGLGGGKFHVGGEAGEVDTVYLGIFRADALREVGSFDVQFVRGQDWELNQRLRAAGYRIWFDPRLQVEYRPRNSLGALRRQFYDTGRWRGVLTRGERGQSQLRYFAPPVLVLSSLLALPALLYLGVICAVALSAKVDGPTKAKLILVLPTMHYSWGLGFLSGWIASQAPKPQ